MDITVRLDTKYIKGVMSGAGSAYWARDLEFTGSGDSLAFYDGDWIHPGTTDGSVG